MAKRASDGLVLVASPTDKPRCWTCPLMFPAGEDCEPKLRALAEKRGVPYAENICSTHKVVKR